MKESILMRVLFCKIHCPFICFCKNSAAHLYTSKPLKLENSAPNVVSTAIAVSDDKLCGEVKEDGVNGKEEPSFVGKSCIRKFPDSTKELGKKRVQWIDNFGKELAEIKEFESSETGDTDNEEESSRCLCAIL